MGQLYAEVASAQLSKSSEELCGDKIEVTRTAKDTIIVVSDGLGSGVKANILATLTTKIASSMLKRGIPLEEVVSTIADTLPVCRERKIAYSTLQIIKINNGNRAKIVEFDCPASFLCRFGQVQPILLEEKQISGKLVKEGTIDLQENDVIVAVTDGIIHAGIGGLLPLGWGWRGVAKEIEQECSVPASDAETISQRILRCCEGYYMGHQGDDSSIVAVKLRKPRYLTLFTGPPANIEDDVKVTRRFLLQLGRKIVAGGTTANIVSRVTGRALKVELAYFDPKIPPIGFIEGIDLVTEGLLTLNAAAERLSDLQFLKKTGRQDGASQLARELLVADVINVYAGRAINPVHQNPMFPSNINLKVQVLNKLCNILSGKGKKVIIEWF